VKGRPGENVHQPGVRGRFAPVIEAAQQLRFKLRTQLW
jgi:hypothetical protein